MAPKFWEMHEAPFGMRRFALAQCLASALAAAGPSQTLLAPGLDTLNSSLSLNQTLRRAGLLKSLDSVECPSGTGSGMKVVTMASASCADVQAEIEARVAGESSWTDPHNGGTYTEADFGGTLSASRVTGDGSGFTDHMIFTLSDDGSGCKIEACSRSQVPSLFDSGTNYCNLKMLYCGSADGCTPVTHDFTVETEETEKFAESNVDLSACLVA